MGTLYRATWSYSLVLIMPQNGTDAHALHALRNIFLQNKPERVTNIEARYTVSALSAACNASPDPKARTLAVEGYIQLSNGLICLYDVDRWVPNTKWTHVGGKLIENEDYKKYKASKEDTTVYIHKQIHGTPAICKGGRKPRADKVWAKTIQFFFISFANTRALDVDFIRNVSRTFGLYIIAHRPAYMIS